MSGAFSSSQFFNNLQDFILTCWFKKQVALLWFRTYDEKFILSWCMVGATFGPMLAKCWLNFEEIFNERGNTCSVMVYMTISALKKRQLQGPSPHDRHQCALPLDPPSLLCPLTIYPGAAPGFRCLTQIIKSFMVMGIAERVSWYCIFVLWTHFIMLLKVAPIGLSS